jgi:hypothetical protein
MAVRMRMTVYDMGCCGIVHGVARPGAVAVDV